MKVKAVLAGFFVICGLFFNNQLVMAAENSDLASNEIYQELMHSKRLVTGQIENVHGVLCVKARLRSGESIFSFCQKHPLLKKRGYLAYSRIAFLNHMYYTLVVHGRGGNSTNRGNVYVPLDFSIAPKPLPEVDSALLAQRKFIKVHLDKQYAGFYAYGKLEYCLPISPGKLRQDGTSVTPSGNFVITEKEEMHYSRLFGNASMSHSMQLLNGHYFLHGGPVPGYPASHGCIRFFLSDIENVFKNWVEIGTPGQTVGSRPGSFAN